MKNDKKTTLWERYLTKEIGIEFKACLYFFAILFFYCIYRITQDSFDAGIIHMAQMIITCYVICYIQVYVFGNFDEAGSLGLKEYAGLALCTCLYCIVSYFCSWFEKKITVSLILAGYILVTYLCVILVYRTKRRIDDKKLNEELRIFQTEHKKTKSE